MDFKTIVHFDKATWDQFGSKWLSEAKKEELNGIVYGVELTSEDQKVVESYGFSYEECLNKDYRLKDLNFNCLLTKCNVLPKKIKKEEDEVVCNLTSRTAFDIISCVSNLQDRASLVNLFEDKILQKYGGYLSADFVLASADFWEEFSSFQNSIIALEAEEKPYLGGTNADDLFLNLYFSFFEKFKIKVNR
ncbi:MAG: hypothetical protein WCG45_02320 [bacterium]